VASYGSVSALEQQNTLVITETAGQIRRIASIVEQLDREDPEGAVEIIPIKHARADALMGPLKALLSQKVEKYVINQQGQQVKLEENEMRGLTMTADTRTNSIIAKGVQAKIDQLKQAIELLDVPAVDSAQAGDRAIFTATLHVLPASEVAARLTQLFAGVDEKVRPTVLSLDEQSKVVVIGRDEHVSQAKALLRELEPDAVAGDGAAGAGTTPEAPQAVVIELQRATDAAAVLRAVGTLLNKRQQAVMKLAPGADNKSLIVTGLAGDVASVRSLVEALDRDAGPIERQVRQTRIAQGDPVKIVDDARKLFDQQMAGQDEHVRALAIEVDPDDRLVTAVGSQRAVEQFTSTLRMIEQNVTIDRDAKRIAIEHALPSEIAATLNALAPALLQPQDGSQYVAPTITGVDSLKTLVVTATPAQMPVLESLAAELERSRSDDDRTVRLLTLANADANQVAQSVDAMFNQAVAPPSELKPIVRVDAASNSLLVRANDRQYAEIENLVKQIDRATIASTRQMRLLPVDPSRANASEIAEALRKLLGEDGSGGAGGGAVEVMTLDELLKRRETDDSAKRQAPGGGAGAGAQSMALPVVVAMCMFTVSQDAPPATQPAPADSPDVTIAVDDATNSLLLLGSPRAIERITALIQQMQQQMPAAAGRIRSIALPPDLDARHIANMVTQALAKFTPAGGAAGDVSRRVSIIADGPSNALIIAASDRDFDVVADLIAAIGKPPSQKFPVRTITLTKAAASAVATAIQQFYDKRAALEAQRRDAGGGAAAQQSSNVAVMAIESSNTLLVCANDADFAEVQKLVEQFDTAEASAALEFRVFPLRHARATEIERTVQSLVNDLIYSQPDSFMYYWPPRPQNVGKRDMIAVRADARLNTLIVTGRGDKFDVVEQMIQTLDAPPPEGVERVVRLYRPSRASINLVADMISAAFNASRQRRPWEPPDPTAVNVRVDEHANVILVSATEKEQEQIAEMIKGIDAQIAAGSDAASPAGSAPAADALKTKVLAVQFARAREIAETLTRFLSDRAKATNASRPRVTIVPSDGSNSLVVAAAEADIAQIEVLLKQLDQQDVAGDRTVDMIALQHGNAEEIARILREQFGRRASGGAAAGMGVVVTPDPRSNSVIINAPAEEFAQAQALVARLDTPPAADETIIRTYALKGARADEAVRILTQTLQLDARGRTPGKGISIKVEGSDAPPVEVKATVVADRRSNSLVVTATQESFPIIESLVSKLEEVPAASPVEWRIFRLQHAVASEVSWTLNQIGRAMALDASQPQPRIDYNRIENQLVIAATSDQFKQIESILQQIDQPSPVTRTTDFVGLRFAKAQDVRDALSIFYGSFAAEASTPARRNVRIVADPATNSLVISAAQEEWEGIRALIAKLDNEEYDASLQLKVLALTHADAASVANAINNAFQGQVTGDQRSLGARPPARQPQDPNQGGRPEDVVPTMLVQTQDWVRASAEPQTNSVIVSASRPNLAKVEEIVKQLDVSDYATLPPPRIIPITSGDPLQMATALQPLFEQARSGGAGSQNRRATRIVGNAASNSIIVRADDEDFAQIKALAEALQEQASSSGLSVSVIRAGAVPAARIASAITEAFTAKAKQLNQTLTIKVDPTGNNLIVAAPGPLTDEIRETVKELDSMAPAAGQGIFIIDLQNITPDAAKTIIETIGLDKPQPADSISRMVSEPIKVSLFPGAARNGIIVVANPADRDTIVNFLKAVDSAPAMAEAQVIVVPLKQAQAGALAALLQNVLKPTEQQADTPLARAIREQVRRLSVHKGSGEGGDGAQDKRIALDLTKPVKITPEPQTNSLIVSSTYENVTALEEIIGMFDRLPITEAVTVQIFPLQNIAADQFARIVKDLLTQGKALGKVGPAGGAGRVQGMPEGAVGKALLDDLAISTDERTNSVIVAGTEDAVALVEVMRTRLDGDMSSAWVEPKVLPLRFADAGELAETLDAILVQGATNLPQSSPLQKQVARLRVARLKPNGGAVVESDVFTPMTKLVIRPETQLNALILVGTPANIEVISELVAMLDIEAASPASSVRIYPLENASASRLATTIKGLFDAQVQSRAIRPEDRVIVQGDDRTNALIVTTSPRSFAVLENLLKTLDTKLSPELSELKHIELKHASAARLASLIQQLMDSRLERLRKVQPETADLERATIVADGRTNSLVVAAGPESFEVIKQLAADLDTTTLGDAALVQVVPVTGGGANLDRLAQTINQIMQRRYADLPQDLRNSQRPLVLTDNRTSSLLVAANPEDFAAIQDLVTKLAAAPSNPAVGLHVIPLGEGTRAELLAPRLQKLMQDRAASLGPAATPSDRVSIEPDPASNSLIVAASEENLQVVRGLIDMLIAAEREAAGEDGGDGQRMAREIEFVPLVASRASEIVDLLQDLYIEEANRTRGRNVVRVTADDRTNAVLINAPGSDVRALRNLIAQLDGARPASVVEIKYVPLTSANAVETVSLIENVLSGRGIGGRRNPRQATVLKYLREIAEQNGAPPDGAPPEPGPGGDVEMQVSAAIRESITLTPDLRTNTIIVAAPRESIDMIERMIRDLDSSTGGSKNIRIFKLVNADALAMAEILADLFQLRQGSSMYVLKPREDGTMAPAPMEAAPLPEGAAPAQPAPAAGPAPIASLSGTDLTAVPDERQQLSITVDSRTNSLIVSGTPTYLDLVDQVVKELDALEANEREVYVYQLRNAVAAEVARVLTEFVDQEQKKLIGTLSPDQLGSAARLLEREITIKGDEASNTVLVSASPRYMERVKEMIKQLDIDPPQVLIQVMLAEVTLDTRDDWGVNMRFAADLGSSTLTGGYGLARNFLPGLGVPNIAIASDDFTLLVRALKAQGRLQVLSNPSIMAANNSPARIQVGETVRLPAYTAISDTGQTSTTLEKEELGVILQVTPSINPDGFVRMDINPEISNLSQRTTQVSEDFSSPIITRRNADTTVTVMDGQTIVIGGLISDRFERRDRKVPFFGDLPLVGPLFRSNTEETAKTELLIVLTPHVIDSPAHFDRVDEVTLHEIDRLSLPENVKEQIRQGQLEGTGGLYDSKGNLIRVKEEDEQEQQNQRKEKP
jgi:type II secretion system protein D